MKGLFKNPFKNKIKKKSGEISIYYPLFFTVVFIIVLLQYPFSVLEAIFYDLRVVLDVGVRDKNNIVIITLDEESEQFLGERYPYTYTTHARFVSNLISDGPKIISYFITLPDPAIGAEFQELEIFKKKLIQFQENGGGFRFGTEMDVWGEQLPPESLQDLGYSLALLHVDSTLFAKDEVSRRAILNISGEDSLHLWAANQVRKMQGEPSLEAKKIFGSYYSSEADATYVLYRYYTSPLEKDKAIPKIPYHRVAVGNFPKGFFKGKIVLVGSQYVSKSTDFIFTPYEKENLQAASKMNVHAQIIQSLIHEKTIWQIPRTVTDILTLLLGLILSFVISQVRPTKGLLLIIFTMVGLVTTSFLTFSFLNTWVYLTHLILAVFIVYYIWVPFRAIAEYQTRYTIEEETKLLKKVDHLKQNFISLMSHDLKTPVAKIAGIAEILANQFSLSEKQKDHVMSIINSTKELNQFITSILDLTKIESQNLKLQQISKDINTVVETVVSNLRYEAGQKNIEINLKLSPLYPIKMDVDLVKRVISNLVENAIKYSGNGGRVAVSTWDDEKWVYLKIEDTGIGIAQENLEHVFDKFYRVQNDSIQAVKGFGLGLYLVKYFVELHGGIILVESVLGQGTTFLVKLKNE